MVVNAGLLALLGSLLGGRLAYVAVRSKFKYGLGAVIALVHDVFTTFAFLLYQLFRLARPFLPALLVSVMLAITFSPAYRWVHARVRNANLAAAILTLDAVGEWTTSSIGVGGGTFTVHQAGSPVDGLEVTVPPNGYGESRVVRVSYAAIRAHQLGRDFHPISPLISISNGGGYASAPMRMKIPCRIPAGEFAMAFYYNPATGELEGIPLLREDSTSLTILTSHFTSSSIWSGPGAGIGGLSRLKPGDVDLSFSQVVVSSIPEVDLTLSYESGFKPGVDDWQFNNLGSYVEPKGHCAGQSIAAIWYYDTKKSTGGALWGRFDNDGNSPKTPGIWQDDVLAYKFCTMLQHSLDWNSISRR